MSGPDVSHLSGPDAVVALRTFPRRFRLAVLPLDDPEVEELAYRVGPDGHSALDQVHHATATFVLLTRALHDLLATEPPTLLPAVTDPGARGWDTPPGLLVGDALDLLHDAAGALADAAERIHSPDWSREAPVAGGGSVTALDLVREAARAGGEALAAAERTLAAVR